MTPLWLSAAGAAVGVEMGPQPEDPHRRRFTPSAMAKIF